MQSSDTDQMQEGIEPPPPKPVAANATKASKRHRSDTTTTPIPVQDLAQRAEDDLAQAAKVDAETAVLSAQFARATLNCSLAKKAIQKNNYDQTLAELKGLAQEQKLARAAKDRYESFMETSDAPLPQPQDVVDVNHNDADGVLAEIFGMFAEKGDSSEASK